MLSQEVKAQPVWPGVISEVIPVSSENQKRASTPEEIKIAAAMSTTWDLGTQTGTSRLLEGPYPKPHRANRLAGGAQPNGLLHKKGI